MKKFYKIKIERYIKMIVVRNTLNLKFGKFKEAKPLLKEGLEINKEFGFPNARILTDLTGESYRIILEIECKNMGDWENRMANNPKAYEHFQKWYEKLVPLCEGGSREILNLVE